VSLKLDLVSHYRSQFRIFEWRKDKKHISTEEIDESEDNNASPTLKPSMFDRLQSSTLKKCPSVFTHIWKGKDHRISVFSRIKHDPQPKPSVFSRIKAGKNSSNSQLQPKKSSAFSCLGMINEV